MNSNVYNLMADFAKRSGNWDSVFPLGHICYQELDMTFEDSVMYIRNIVISAARLSLIEEFNMDMNGRRVKEYEKHVLHQLDVFDTLYPVSKEDEHRSFEKAQFASDLVARAGGSYKYRKGSGSKYILGREQDVVTCACLLAAYNTYGFKSARMSKLVAAMQERVDRSIHTFDDHTIDITTSMTGKLQGYGNDRGNLYNEDYFYERKRQH